MEETEEMNLRLFYSCVNRELLKSSLGDVIRAVTLALLVFNTNITETVMFKHVKILPVREIILFSIK